MVVVNIIINIKKMILADCLACAKDSINGNIYNDAADSDNNNNTSFH